VARLLWAAALVVCLSVTAWADTIYVDKMEPAEDGKPASVRTGDFELRQRDVTTASRGSFELVNLVIGDAWESRAADGAGDDLAPNGDLSMTDVLRWWNRQRIPADRVYIALQVSSPVGETSSAAAIRQFSMRLGGREFSLGDQVVVSSKDGLVGEALLVLEPGFPITSVNSPDLNSFAANIEVTGPPGTACIAYLTSVSEGTVIAEGEPQLNSAGSGGGSLRPTPLYAGGLRLAGNPGPGRRGTSGYKSRPGLGPFFGGETYAPPVDTGSWFDPASPQELPVIDPPAVDDPVAEDPADDDEPLAPDDIVEPWDPIAPEPDLEDPFEPTPEDPIYTPEDPVGPTPSPIPPTPNPPTPTPPDPPPVPEPTSLVLLAVGGALLGSRRTRRSRG
jgi:hypothetical protein